METVSVLAYIATEMLTKIIGSWKIIMSTQPKVLDKWLNVYEFIVIII